MKKIILLLSLTAYLMNTSLAQQKISEKQLFKKVKVNLSAKKVWQKWSTHDGLKTFFGEDNKIDLRPGGEYEIYFKSDATEGSRGSEGCTVLSFIPNEMLSFTWVAPPTFKALRESGYKTWVVVQFLELTPRQTEVTITHLGWPEGEEWNPVYEYFDKAWEYVLNQLVKSTEKK